MHTNTFTSRFKVGDKITDGTTTITIDKIAIDTSGVVYYRTQERTYPEERNLTNYHLAPKYPIGSKVWIISYPKIREVVVETVLGAKYVFKDTACVRYEDEVFLTSAEALATIKIIPLN